MSQEEHEHDEGDEAAETPVSTETVLDDEQDAEEAEAAETPPDEPGDAPEPQGAQQDEWEKRYASAEKYFATYTRRIAEKWGDDAIHLAPFNIDPSAPPGFIDMRNAGHVDEDTKAAAMEFLGFPREQDYADDPYTQTCATCHGKTKTKTGSADPQYATRTCPTCKAYGYTIDGRAPSEVGTPANGATPTLVTAIENLASEEFDAWNQPRILPNGVPNPNYGRTPDHWQHIPPWGDTRGLTAQDVATA